MDEYNEEENVLIQKIIQNFIDSPTPKIDLEIMQYYKKKSKTVKNSNSPKFQKYIYNRIQDMANNSSNDTTLHDDTFVLFQKLLIKSTASMDQILNAETLEPTLKSVPSWVSDGVAFDYYE